MTIAEKKQIAQAARQLSDGMTVPGIDNLPGWVELRRAAAMLEEHASAMVDALAPEAPHDTGEES